MSSLPSVQKALTATADHKAEVTQVEVPKPNKGEVIIKNEWVALNPTDWKHIAFISTQGAISGCDLAGTIVSTGEGVSESLVGKRVAGLVHGGVYKDRGAFQQYTRADPSLQFIVPDNVELKDASTLGVATFTSNLALYKTLGLPTPDKPLSQPKDILIWSGATSVGQHAIQLAKLSGLRVITTASEKNHALLRSLGADEVFDYKDEQVVQKIKKATNNQLELGLDCISEKGSVELSTDSFGSNGGRLTLLLPYAQEKVRSDVKLQPVLAYTITGTEFTLFGKRYPAIPEDHEDAANWTKKLTQILASGKLKFIKTTELKGGLESIIEGFEKLSSGKVSGEKLVYNVSSL
ncbi:trans-enoyl reductase [Acrasis kona]|uniref:Trans-enoyl reductase n=1 Tax=Acrasis kona TaxID=1008807 RepID=A0AAW2YNW1_9EUKA